MAVEEIVQGHVQATVKILVQGVMGVQTHVEVVVPLVVRVPVVFHVLKHVGHQEQLLGVQEIAMEHAQVDV